MRRLALSAAQLLLFGLLLQRGTPALAQANPSAEFDQDYTLQASMLGYRGVGGEIEGVRNPTLRAARGERVRITIVGVENLPHDIALEKLGIKSREVTTAGEKSVITFTAQDNDTYYCTMPGHRAAGMVGQFEISQERPTITQGSDVVSDGRTLNLGFESGTLQDWVANGEAFGPQSVRQDRTPNPATRHEGGFWVTSGDTTGYLASGSLTSARFTVTQPWASFRVAGGALADTRVEIVRADGDSVIYQISGYGGRALRPVVVDLTRHVGKQIYVRLVDRESGLSGLPYIRDNKLAFIAFDAFKQYATRPAFPNELTPQEVMILPPLNVIKNAGLSGKAAAEAMELPDGFRVALAASEPEVVRPIAFTMDDRGRLWVVEGNTYPVRAPEGQGRDRVLILEDTNGDGTLDSRKVAMEGLNLVSGIEVGFGGVWLGAAPYLLFVPMDAATDRPTGPPQVMLDGWGYQDTHETLNSLTWGPDGWLYGTQGIFTKSSIGRPGAPEAERTPMNAGVWRFHPRTHVFEVFADGTSNPWGVDFDELGQAFVTACVIPHLFHMIQGAHYQLQAGKHLADYIYDDIQTVADHRHWVGTYGPHAGNNRSDDLGGGHAHAGAMFYLGGSWPAEYRGRLFMNNVHGARMNTDILERQGSGYVGHHGKDFLVTNDSWSQMIDMQYGPDGSVWVIDWYDKNQCHSANPDVHQKTLGRIFRITYRTDTPVKVDLQKLTSLQLAEMTLNQNDWYVRHARRILQERGPDPAVAAALKRIVRDNGDVTRRLRALWALHAVQGLSDTELTALLSDGNEHVRSWAVQLLAEDGRIPAQALTRMAAMSRTDASPVVRMYLASGIQRVPAEQRWDVLAGLSAHGEDAADHNLPLMVWYAAAAMPGASMDRALGMALDSRLPTLLPYTVQRMASLDKQAAVRTLSARMGTVTDARQQAELLKGLNLLVTPAAPAAAPAR